MTPPYVSIKNLEQYQHYKHRNPPWIKLYYSLLNDEAFLTLDEVQQCRYMKLLLLASRHMNCISTDPNYLGKVLRISEQVDINPLIQAGFLLAHRKRKGGKMLASRNENRVSETETETETETENNPPLPPKGEDSLPEWLPIEAWRSYLDMRREIKKALTKHGQKLAIEKLTTLRSEGHDPKAVLDQSTFNSWQGLFAPKGATNGTRSGHSYSPGNHPAPPGKYAHLGTVFDPGGED